MTTRSTLFAGLAAASLGAVTLPATPASACGGFFCSASQPVNQQAERIVFAKTDSGVLATIQIQYQGPSEQFAWLLPVAGSPEVSVSTNAAFDRLQAATNPQYQLNVRTEGTCVDDNLPRASAGSVAFSAESAPEDESGGGAVSVVDSGSVGPYDYVTIAVDPEAEELVDVALDWLRENGYDVPEMSSDVLRPYLEAGMNLIAFRLSKGNDEGSIRPIQLAFGEGLASIPLRPTAVAAQPDMGILVWLLGDHRAIPANYRSLELNEALIDWMNPGPTYNDVVTRAADEAGGQGFVTEHAGDPSPLAEMIWQEWEQGAWEEIRNGNWEGEEGSLVDRTGFLIELDGAAEVFAKHLPAPEGVSEEDFQACPFCYADWAMADIEGLEPADFIADLETEVVQPLIDFAAMFGSAGYTTRLYTTMSAEEMTVDPLFDFNGDLPEVSNQHMADRIIECSPTVPRSEAPWRVEFPNGQVLRGAGNAWPTDQVLQDMPANARVLRVGTEGEGEVVEDNLESIQKALAEHNEALAAGGGDDQAAGRGEPGTLGADDGCSANPNGPRTSGLSSLALLLAVGGLLGLRQRRRR